MEELFGLAGLTLIIIAWIPGILKTIKTKKPDMERKFMLLYFLGSASLAYQAYILDSISFLILNVLASIVPIIHFYYSLKRN